MLRGNPKAAQQSLFGQPSLFTPEKSRKLDLRSTSTSPSIDYYLPCLSPPTTALWLKASGELDTIAPKFLFFHKYTNTRTLSILKIMLICKVASRPLRKGEFIYS